MKKTRKLSSVELLALVKKGPFFSDVFDKPYTPEKATAQYRIWADSWVVPLLEQLVPELKPVKFQCNRCHRRMQGSAGYDGACECGGLIEVVWK
jgi:hypothetical protein